MERKLGEVFPYKGEYFKVVKERSLYSCEGCCFNEKNEPTCMVSKEEEIGPCLIHKRSDKTGIIFIKADSPQLTEKESEKKGVDLCIKPHSQGINNFHLVENLLPAEDDKEYFYFLQIIRRSKDHKGKSNLKSKLIKSYFISSYAQLMEKKKEIILLCEYYGARAYLNPSPKSWAKFQRNLLVKCALQIDQGQVSNPFKMINSVAGELQGDKKLWLIDIDSKDPKDLVNVKYKLLQLYSEHNQNAPDDQLRNIHLTVPTLQGYHVITDPFDVNKFQQLHVSFANVHKNSAGMLLYVPVSLYVDNVVSFIDQD